MPKSKVRFAISAACGEEFTHKISVVLKVHAEDLHGFDEALDGDDNVLAQQANESHPLGFCVAVAMEDTDLLEKSALAALRCPWRARTKLF